MLAYAANRRPEGRRSSPISLAIILAGHAALIGAVMTARTVIERAPKPLPTIVDLIRDPIPPEPVPLDPPKRPNEPTESVVPMPDPVVPIPALDPPRFDPGPPILNPTPDIGGKVTPQPLPLPDPPKAAPVRKAARFVTPDELVRPPYPEGKIAAQQVGSLRLRLQIDARGRVVAVEALGSPDPAFVEAARRHILRHWRYQPATEDGAAVASSTVVTLRFELTD